MNLWWPRTAFGATTSITYQPFNFNLSWQPGMAQGVQNWNTSNASVNFQPNANSNNTVRVLNGNDWEALGRLRSHRSTSLTAESTTVRFELELNVRTINAHVNNNPNWSRHNVIESIMTHELGHTIALIDNPTGGGGRASNGSIMNQGRNRNVLTRPTNFDVISVNMIYN